MKIQGNRLETAEIIWQIKDYIYMKELIKELTINLKYVK